MAEETFGETGQAYIAPALVPIEGDAPRAAVSLGVGENETKRISGDFEARFIRALGEKFRTIWIDRGAEAKKARRVTAAAEASRDEPAAFVSGKARSRASPRIDRAIRSLRRLRFRRASTPRRPSGTPLDLDLRGRAVRAFPRTLVAAWSSAH